MRVEGGAISSGHRQTKKQIYDYVNTGKYNIETTDDMIQDIYEIHTSSRLIINSFIKLEN